MNKKEIKILENGKEYYIRSIYPDVHGGLNVKVGKSGGLKVVGLAAAVVNNVASNTPNLIQVTAEDVFKARRGAKEALKVNCAGDNLTFEMIGLSKGEMNTDDGMGM